MKAKSYKEVKSFQDIPNIGPAIANKLGLIGIYKPTDLIKRDPYKLYLKMCEVSGVRQDPCLFDTYIAAVDFMNGAPARPWFYYTKNRKKNYPGI